MRNKIFISEGKTSFDVKIGLSDMLKGGVILDVSTPDQARIAEDSGAVAVIAYDKNPSGIPLHGKLARMSDPELIQSIQESVSIPVMAKCRIGHFVEAQILEALFIDFIDESESFNSADNENYINKHTFRIPFMCGSTNLGETLRRIAEGASLIRTKIEGDSRGVAETVRQLRKIKSEIRQLVSLDPCELMNESIRLNAPYQLVQEVAKKGKLPVPYFASGDITTPADVALMMHLGAESVLVGSKIFKSDDPVRSARAIVQAATCFNDPHALAKISSGLLDIPEENAISSIAL